MKREEAITILKTLWNNPLFNDSHKEALNIAIEALEHPKKNVISIVPCGDAISRQAAIDALTKTSGIRGDALKALYDLPSVTPQPKMGHWIEHVERDDWDDSEEVWYECDQCHVGSERVSNYCPACGAKMSEGSGE